MEVTARVIELLRDDTFGVRHQRFIVRIGPLTVLIAHNLDLAPRVPVRVGDEIRLRGEYTFNKKGGVIHWTHRDPRGRHPTGFIRLRDRTYR